MGRLQHPVGGWGNVPICKFPSVQVLEGTLEMAKTVIGTPYYMSPELFKNQPYSYKYPPPLLFCCYSKAAACVVAGRVGIGVPRS